MRTLETIAELRHQVRSARQRGERIGYVPTSSPLHEGQQSLVRLAHAQCDLVVASAPRENAAPGSQGHFLLEGAGADLLWVAGPADLMRRDDIVRLTIRGLGEGVWGAFQTDAFSRQSTQLVKQLAVVQPDVLYVGAKDFAHAVVVKRVVEDLLLPVEVRTSEVIRDPDGLPVSYRNLRLSPRGRRAALQLPRALQAATAAREAGERSVGRIRAKAEVVLAEHPLVVPEYAEVVDAESLSRADILAGQVILVVAALIEGVRLTDSCALTGSHLPAATTASALRPSLPSSLAVPQ